MTKRLLILMLLLPVFALAAGTPSDTSVDESAGMYSPFYRLINYPETLAEKTLKDIDYSIFKVALYQIEDRRSREVSKATHAMLESRITEKLVQSGRFRVMSCIECKTTRVSFINQELKVTQPIEDNEQLKLLGEKIGADAFLLWRTIATETSESLSFRLVKAEDNSIIWAKQYTDDEITNLQQVHYDIYVGLIGQKTTRIDTITADTVKLDSLATFGVRRKEKAAFDPAVEFSLAAELVTSLFAPKEFDLYGIMLEGRVFYDTQWNADFVPIKIYAGIGEVFFPRSQNLFARTGVEFSLGDNGFIDVGLFYLRDTNVRWGSDGNYQRNSTLGGMTGELILGIQL